MPTAHETAAAILVQTLFDNNQGLRSLLNAVENKVSETPETAAKFLMPYYVTMLDAVKKAGLQKQPAPR